MASLHLKLANRVRKGAAKLDRYFKGRDWRKKIDKDRLVMNSCFQCMLGHLFGTPQFNTGESGFSIGARELKIIGETLGSCGFDAMDADWEAGEHSISNHKKREKFWDVLKSLWVKEIGKA